MYSAYTDGVTETRAPNGTLSDEEQVPAVLEPTLYNNEHRLDTFNVPCQTLPVVSSQRMR